LNDNQASLDVLLGSRGMMRYTRSYTRANVDIDPIYDISFDRLDQEGYVLVDPKQDAYGGVSPISPLKVRNFMKGLGLIKSTRRATIEAVLEWAKRLMHAESIGTQDAFLNSGFRGASPAYSMMKGYRSQDPSSSSYQHVIFQTGGCHNTSSLFHQLLRATNVPATALMHASNGDGHSMMGFPSEGLYVSHGDSPYQIDRDVPSGGLLLNQAQFDLWLAGANSPEYQVSRSEHEAEIIAPGIEFAFTYCQDIQAGHTHLNGWVYQYLALPEMSYSVAELEGRGLWTRLNSIVTQAGGCANVTSRYYNYKSSCWNVEPWIACNL